jgi:hypothetical protein
MNFHLNARNGDLQILEEGDQLEYKNSILPSPNDTIPHMKGPYFTQKYYSLENTELSVILKGLSIQYNFTMVALKRDENPSKEAVLLMKV